MFVFSSKREIFQCLPVVFLGLIFNSEIHASLVFDDSHPPVYKVRGDYFIVTWDASRGGEITEIMLQDTERWNKINTFQQKENYDCILRLVLSDGVNEYYLAEVDTAAFELIANTSNKIVFKFNSKTKDKQWICYHVDSDTKVYCLCLRCYLRRSI